MPPQKRDLPCLSQPLTLFLRTKFFFVTRPRQNNIQVEEAHQRHQSSKRAKEPPEERGEHTSMSKKKRLYVQKSKTKQKVTSIVFLRDQKKNLMTRSCQNSVQEEDHRRQQKSGRKSVRSTQVCPKKPPIFSPTRPCKNNVQVEAHRRHQSFRRAKETSSTFSPCHLELQRDLEKKKKKKKEKIYLQGSTQDFFFPPPPRVEKKRK